MLSKLLTHSGRQSLLALALGVLFVRWYKSLHETLRLKHRGKETHPVLHKWMASSRTLREGYTAPAWLSLGTKFLVGSLHTVLHNVLRRGKPVPEAHYDRELFTLSCGGTVAIDWVRGSGDLPAPCKDDSSKPIVLIHHGLAGCSRSHYVQSLISFLTRTEKFRVAVMVARGCGGVPLTTPYGFTAAGYNDLGEVIAHIKGNNPNAHMYGVGYSLGAGLMANYLGRSGKGCLLSGAVVVSPCWDYLKTTPYFEIWSRKFLAASLKEYTHYNRHVIKEHEKVNLDAALSAVNTREFDANAVVPVHGFESVDDYYFKSSPITFAHDIHVPTLALSADDDPVCSVEGAEIMEAKNLHGPGLLVARTHRGGHVSWAEGALGYDSFMDRIILEWIETCEAHDAGAADAGAADAGAVDAL